MARLAVVAAGGTGGHLFPAEALARALAERGWRVMLATDERGAVYAEHFPAERRLSLSAATAKRGDILGMIRAGFRLLAGVMQARAAYKKDRPAVVIGFGGYPSVPGLLAATSLKIPTVIHEQNAVMGRANRKLAARATTLACAFPVLAKAPPGQAERAHVVGNPVRPEIRALAELAYEAPEPDGPIRILVTGGSQGARLISETVPAAIAALPEDLRLRLEVAQQSRPESLDIARRLYIDALVKAEISPFFRDMASRLARAHLVIGRSGSGSVNEFAIAGRPSVLVPLAIALDDDQGQNAKVLADAGGAVMIREKNLTVDTLAETLNALLPHAGRLIKMAERARTVARPHAAEALADLVEQTAG